ncbi:outer membrane protein assembly factor BamB family protein [Nocardiopsis alba]|uniref:outer membrane protein assembly factor BamB family protein n=1 Tax=Nocardiopsis alba TaxID=53437 RepID=UPI0035DC4575
MADDTDEQGRVNGESRVEGGRNEYEGARSRPLADIAVWTGLGVALAGVVITPFVPLLGGVAEGLGVLWFLALGIGAVMLWSGAVDARARNAGTAERGRPIAGEFLAVAVLLVGACLLLFPDEAVLPFADEGWRPSALAVFQYAVLVLLTVCLLVLGLTGRRPERLSRSRRPLTVVAGALSVSLIGIVAGYTSLSPLVEHTRAEAGEPPQALSEVSQVGWEWTPGEETRVRGISRGVRGPIVRLTDGFVALDGSTGEELWTYRRPHDAEVEHRVVGNGTRARMVWESPKGERFLTVLDTATGEIVVEREHVESGDWTEIGTSWASAEVDLEAGHKPQEGRRAVRALDLETAEEAWSLSLKVHEGDCFLEGVPESVILVGDVLVVPYGCGRDDRDRDAWLVVALDVESGDEVWRHEREIEMRGPVRVRSGVGRSLGEATTVVAVGDDLHAPRAYLDVRTGEEVAILSESPPIEDEEAREGVDVLRESGDGAIVLRPVPGGELSEEGRYDLTRTDTSGSVLDTVRVGGERRDLFYDSGYAMALGEDTVLIPHRGLGMENMGELAVLSVPLGGGSEAEKWIEVAEPGAAGAGESNEHRLLAVPGAVLSFSYRTDREGRDRTVLYGLVP